MQRNVEHHYAEREVQLSIMRRISVNLSNQVEQTLNTLMKINECSISDIVNAAIIYFGTAEQPCIESTPDALRDLRKVISESKYKTFELWCFKRNLKPERVRYLLRNTNSGKRVWGFGNSVNKWRDQEDERTFKTHTAWIAHCLKEDFDIDLI